MWPHVGRFAAIGAAAAALAGCNLPTDVGYVEITTVPVTSATVPPLYLDLVKIDAPAKGSAVLQQRVGTVTLATDGVGGKLALLCDVIVRKNRITSVTISVLERPPRCQCRSGGGVSNRTCIS
jgi:hypothetical protein